MHMLLPGHEYDTSRGSIPQHLAGYILWPSVKQFLLMRIEDLINAHNVSTGHSQVMNTGRTQQGSFYVMGVPPDLYIAYST